MKMKPLLLLLLALAGASAAVAQSVVVTPRKQVFRRPKPIMDFKKTFVVNFPKVRAATPALARRIEAALSYEKAFAMSFKEEMGELQWLEEADFAVAYNKNGVLAVDLSINGTGAYPDGSTKSIVVDLKTGARVNAAAVFENLDGLAARVKKLQQAEIKKSIEEIKKNPDGDETPEDLFASADFTRANLDGFTLDDRGVTFVYDYGFPHVIQALEPDGRFFMSWTELRPFIKPSGLLARFVR